MSIIKRKSLGRHSGVPSNVIDDYVNGSSRLRDAIKTLRTNIQFAGIDRDIKTIVVTSTNKGEGKTTTTCNLGLAMAEAGKRTLLIENDCRHPMLGNRLKLRPQNGFVSYLYGKSKLEDIITETAWPGLFLLDAEPHISNPVEIIDSKKYSDMIEEVKKHFDMIIFDTPPLGSFIEAALVAAKVDATLLVISPNSTDIDKVTDVLEQLNKANARVLGAVLNGVEMKRSSYSYYYYDYYGDGKKTKKRARKVEY